MGQKDTITKNYMSDNGRFADVFNYIIYNGEPVIRQDMLRDVSPEELLVLETKENIIVTKDKMRDLEKVCIMKRDESIIYMLLGIENASEVHYAQPVRNFIGYADQVEKLSKENRKEKRLKSGAEFLSGIRKDDKIKAIITLTIYFGLNPWDGPKSLHDMLDVEDKRILRAVPNYKLNLIDPHEVEDTEKFISDFRYIAEFMKVAQDKDRMAELLKQKYDIYSNMDTDTAIVMKECGNMEIEIDEREKKTNMCAGIQGMIDDAVKEEHDRVCAGVQGMIDDAVKEEHDRMYQENMTRLLEDTIEYYTDGFIPLERALKKTGLSEKDFLKKVSEYTNR